jgi:hypothetical protein
MIVMGIYSCIVAFIELKVFEINENHFLKDLSLIYSLLGFCVVFVIGFQNKYCLRQMVGRQKTLGTIGE